MARLKFFALIFGMAVGILFMASQAAQAQTFAIVHKFNGFPNDGRMPTAPVILDAQGNIYGTAYAAGKFGGGVVFKKPANGYDTVLHNFTSGSNAAGRNGANPAGLVRDAAGNLYGTTMSGGNLSCPLSTAGCGTVFKLDPSNRLTVLHRFDYTDGALPNAGLLLDAAGNLYGTTGLGGQANNGTVFKIDTSTGHLTVLKSFPNQFGVPAGAIAMDAAGNIYGTYGLGGDSDCECGGVFELTTNHSPTFFTDLLDFTGSNGATPYGGVVIDADDNLYGMTSAGGNNSCAAGKGCGVIFELPLYARETVLYTFSGLADGSTPQASVILDADGNLYGTTAFGGNTTTAGGGHGVVFKLDTSRNETVLHTFNGTDGAQPMANLTMDSTGNLYGTTVYGGSTACTNGCGVVFKVAP
ncbi:MAG TPA: choice-of-anchor tandem repeat GloVer-containing protein [Verrucomicrobiae bacterium]|nr:choice-of-anchor tandem repeat GloVer-containing protein [Verrucomicrobiae bacterium]